MKKTLLFLVPLFTYAQEYQHDPIIFANSRMTGSYHDSRVSSLAPSELQNIDGHLPVEKEIYHTPGNCLKLQYTNDKGKWKVFIHRPIFRGQSFFKTATYLSFWVKVMKPRAKNLPLVSIQLPDSSFSPPMSFKIKKNSKWQHIKILLADFGRIPVDKQRDISGVLFLQNDNTKNSKQTMYVDDIELASDDFSPVQEKPEIESAIGYEKHVDIRWKPVTDPGIKYVKIYRSNKADQFVAVGIQNVLINRYTDYVGSAGKNYQYMIAYLDKHYEAVSFSSLAKASTRKLTDDELLSMVQEANFRYYWEFSEINSGLAKENYPGRQDMIASGASGFGLLSFIVAIERKFITREEGVKRFMQVVDFLDKKAEKYHGAFAHFINGPSGKAEPFFGPKDNGGDLIETAFLVEGLLAARNYFDKDDAHEKHIRETITHLWENIEWDWYKQFPDSPYIYWHWSPDQAFVINHPFIGWNEAMVVYLLAIASPTHGVSPQMYYSGWASQEPLAIKYRSWGGVPDGTRYTNGNTYYGVKLDVGVSNGGPLFFTHYSYLGYDPHFITDRYTNYFDNNRNIALINHAYCKINPKNYKGYGDNCWGLSACDGPDEKYSADEPITGRDVGKIPPTGALASFVYTPEESMKALKNYYYNYGSFLWGEYGFRDAFNLTENWCSDVYMGLNQGPITVMIENYRSQLIWKLFMKDKDIQEGLKKLDAIREK